MRMICIIGRSGSGKSKVESRLESLGYTRSISYTTRKPEEGEQNGKEYHFVTTKEFFELVDKDIIMEWAKYNGNYYGSPHPIGCSNHVVVVEPKGFESIKRIYGKQAIGIYLKVSSDIAQYRAKNRKRLSEEAFDADYENRKNRDDEVFKDIESKVDLVVDASKDIETITAEILKYVSKISNLG